MNILNKPRRAYLGLVAGLLMTVILAACGENTATSSTGPTAGAGLTVGSTTSAVVATTAASSTTASSTTTAAGANTTTTAASATGTTVAGVATTATIPAALVTAADTATTAAGSTPSVTGATLPSISGTTEVSLATAITSQIDSALKISNATIKLYTSDDEAAFVSANTDKACTGSGYSFGVPGATGPQKQGDQYFGFYTKAGSPDLLTVIQAVPTDPAQLNNINIPGVSASDAQAFADQIKGKKSILFVLAAPDLLQAIGANFGSGSGPAPASPATPGPTPTR